VKLKNQALSPSQGVAVVAGLLVMGAGVYGLYHIAAESWHRRGVTAAIPSYLDGVKAQRDSLAQAIEKYHSQFGFYPPNHATNLVGRALVNPLYYELTGTRWNSNLQSFGLPTTKDPVKPALLLKNFNLASFSNSLPFPSWPTNFLEHLGLAGTEENEVIMVNSPIPDGVDEKFNDDFSASTWRYAADPAEHNKGKFDLWIELDVLGQHLVVNNWDDRR
jgi:hypothetical protein